MPLKNRSAEWTGKEDIGIAGPWWRPGACQRDEFVSFQRHIRRRESVAAHTEDKNEIRPVLRVAQP